MNNYTLLIFITLIIVSCAENKQDNDRILHKNFPAPQELKGKQVFEDEFSLLQIVKMDSLIVLVTNRDTLFHVYNSNDNKISSFGNIGKGPNELVRAYAIEDHVSNNDTTYAYINDEIRKEIIEVNITKSIELNTLSVANRLSIPTDLHGTMDLLRLEKSQFFGIYDDRFSKRLDEKRGAFYLNVNTGKFETFNLLNLEMQPYEVMPATNINARMPLISHKKNKIAVVMMHYPRISIISPPDTTRKSYTLTSDKPDKVFQLESFKNGSVISYYPYAFANDEYIYLLKSGDKMNEHSGKRLIQKMNWKGEPINQYLIPHKYNASMFVVNEDLGEIYVLSYNNDKVYKFNTSPR